MVQGFRCPKCSNGIFEHILNEEGRKTGDIACTNKECDYKVALKDYKPVKLAPKAVAPKAPASGGGAQVASTPSTK